MEGNDLSPNTSSERRASFHSVFTPRRSTRKSIKIIDQVIRSASTKRKRRKTVKIDENRTPKNIPEIKINDITFNDTIGFSKMKLNDSIREPVEENVLASSDSVPEFDVTVNLF